MQKSNTNLLFIKSKLATIDILVMIAFFILPVKMQHIELSNVIDYAVKILYTNNYKPIDAVFELNVNYNNNIKKTALQRDENKNWVNKLLKHNNIYKNILPYNKETEQLFNYSLNNNKFYGNLKQWKSWKGNNFTKARESPT